jgi:transposase
VRSIEELFATEREINGLSPEQRLAVPRERSKPLVAEFEGWTHRERRKLSSKTALAEAIVNSLKLWAALTHFLDDGRICLSNNLPSSAPCAASRSAGGIGHLPAAILGGRGAAAVDTLIETCKLNDADPRA